MKKVAYVRSSNIYDDSRATKEISALAEAGYEVSVFGWNRDGKAHEKCKEVFVQYKKSVKCYFYTVKVEGGLGIKNIDKLISWIRWTKRGMKKCGPFDVIHACNLDSALGTWNYGKKTKSKLVYDIYDYYIDSHSIPGVLENIIEDMEVKIINNADLTIICTEERKEQISKATSRKTIVIHNSPEVEKNEEVECKYDYVYCGSLFSQRLLKETFGEYPSNIDLSFAIAGYGEYATQAMELAEKFDNFTYYGPVSYSEVLKIENKSRVISAIYEPTIRNHRLCAPNKFYEALALAKPVIVCKGTGIDKIVKAKNVGIVIDYNAKQFYEAIRKLTSDKKMCAEMGKRARSLYDNEYKWEIMRNRLIEAYSHL